jgi:Anti-sigma-K factor rskA
VDLAPLSARGVEQDWRGQLADYVLGQQAGPEATATRGHLRRSEPARAWTGSLLDSLETLYGERELPSIPAGSRERGRRRPEREEPERGELSPEARAAVRRRRRLAGVLALVALVALVVLVWPVGVLTGDDDEGGGSAASTSVQPTGNGAVPAGIAIVADQGGERRVVVQAAGLEPSKQREAYEVWLYNSPSDAESLGAQVTDSRGTYQGAGPLPADFEKYGFIDLSREPINDDGKHSGQSVLRGKVGKLRERPSNAGADQAVVLGQVVLAPPTD